MINSGPYYFPFGQQLKKVQQTDRTTKKAFVLGVYSSAVHARWVDTKGKEVVKALAVSSEPCIFWTGEQAEQIIAGIKVPSQVGKLTVPVDKNLNGPSGVALDDLFLNPLGLTRQNTWLCDLLPESRVNGDQRKAIKEQYYAEDVKEFDLPEATIPNFDERELRVQSSDRQMEILSELEESKADTLILLGDQPIHWFLHYYDKRYSKLSQFGQTREDYGKPHEIKIADLKYNVIPLCHPRHAARLKRYNLKWAQLHDGWKPEKI